MEPRSTDTRLIRTPGYCGQFRLSRRGKAHTFSLKLTRVIRTLWRVPLVSVLIGFHCNKQYSQYQARIDMQLMLRSGNRKWDQYQGREKCNQSYGREDMQPLPKEREKPRYLDGEM